MPNVSRARTRSAKPNPPRPSILLIPAFAASAGIIAAESQLAASNARIGQALAEYYPKVSLSGVLGSESPAPGVWEPRRSFSLYLAAPRESQLAIREAEMPAIDVVLADR